MAVSASGCLNNAPSVAADAPSLVSSLTVMAAAASQHVCGCVHAGI